VTNTGSPLSAGLTAGLTAAEGAEGAGAAGTAASSSPPIGSAFSTGLLGGASASVWPEAGTAKAIKRKNGNLNMEARNEAKLTKPKGVGQENLRREKIIIDSLFRRERLFTLWECFRGNQYSHPGKKEAARLIILQEKPINPGASQSSRLVLRHHM